MATLQVALEKRGFAEAPRAARLIDGLTNTDEQRAALLSVLDDLLEALGEASDPMRALLNFSRLADVVERTAWYCDLAAHPPYRKRLCRLMAWSQSLADTLIREPALLETLRQPPQPVSRPQLRRLAVEATSQDENETARFDALRRFRRRETLRIALLDMEGQTWRDEDDFNLVVRQISDLAQVCVQEALQVLSTEECLPFAVIGMGKLGARELNYSSDIDLIFLHDGDNAAMQKLGETLFKALSDSSSAGTIHRVDMRLRPDGKSGPLVTSMSYALSYYESYAAAWEWQAMIKSRVLAGDARLGRRFRKFLRGVTWARRADDAHLREMLAMKRRSEATPEGKDLSNVKQGPGSIRDAEWVVQQSQMMVGPSHPRCRASSTLRALKTLQEFGAIAPDEARNLREGYLFLRVLEHRLQLWEERAVRKVPADEAGRAALARRMGFSSRGVVAARQLNEDIERYRVTIRGLCERIFWSWQDGEGVASDSASEAREGESSAPLLQEAAAQQRLRRMSEGTSTHPLPAPLSRQIKAALPAALINLAHAADPERALGNLERLCDASGNRLSLLRTLGNEPQVARAVFAILGGSQWLSDTLIHFPQLLDMAAQRSLLEQPRSSEEARAACRDYCFAFRDRRAALRRWKAREMLRIGLRDLAMDAPAPEITREIADLAQACIALASDEIRAARRPASESVAFAVLGMGKLGGSEMHYSSDADVIFACDPAGNVEDGVREATGWAEELMRFCGERTEDGLVFEIDPRLRPDGRSGPLVRTVQGFVDYFERASNGIAVWERQALTRARFVAGDAATAGRLMAAIRHVAFPDTWQPGWGDELRHIKGRVENERAAKGAKSGEVYDVKLGPGCLSDIEFCAQWLALKHGARVSWLQTPNTLFQIEAARAAELLSDEESRVLSDTYVFLRRAELRLQVTQEHVVKAVKAGSKEWVAWTRSLFPEEPNEVATQRFKEQWQTSTQAARRVMERVRDEL